MEGADFLVIGAGVAGLSAAARLAAHGRVAVIEAEEAIGYHSSGRSATFSHYGIGNRLVRALTAHSRDYFLERRDPPLARTSNALFVATEAMLPALEKLRTDMAEFTDSLRDPAPDELGALFPPLRTGVRLSAIRPTGSGWRIESEAGESWSAPILINAAGAWADSVARAAGVVPLGLRPLRRTIIVVDPPTGADVRDWPFVKTVVDDFYILPESGKLMASPVDEVESDPCDAQPEEYDVALAASKVEQYTTLAVSRIAHRWAGLRTFTADRVPAAGFAPGSPGFFWLAGQGGFGLQTAPAMAEIVETLVTGGTWPQGLAELGVTSDKILPDRLFTQPMHSTSVRTA